MDAAAPKRRRRRTAEEAQEEILRAAVKRLHAGGPESLKLQDIAADVGVSHPAVLHHFGSREALVEAVVNRAISDVLRRILRVITESDSPEFAIPRMVRQGFAMLADPETARLIGWLFLAGHSIAAGRNLLRSIAETAYQALEEETDTVDRGITLDDVVFAILLVAGCALGIGVSQERLFRSAGLEDYTEARARFQAWVSDLMVLYIEGPDSPHLPQSHPRQTMSRATKRS